MNEVVELNKESYIRTKLDITEFQSDDILTGSDHLIEIKPGQDAGGVIKDPESAIPLSF